MPSKAFPGGIHPPGYKELSLTQGIQAIPLPPTLYLPLRQHAGQSATPVVSAGERVLKGQLLARPAAAMSAALHAPASGVVRGMVEHPVPHPSGLDSPCIVLNVDGEDTAVNAAAGKRDYLQQEAAQLIEQIRQAGVVGMGGAAFPSAVKLATPAGTHVDTLLINGAECEPYITCDDMLMRNNAHDIVQGMHILCHILRPVQCVIAIEDNKPEAIAAMRRALQLFHRTFACAMHIRIVPTVYPTGGEKQLIKTVTGREVPSGKLPLHVGVVCQNVATASAIADAVLAQRPLTERIVTVSGDGIRRPGNYRVLLGTPIAHLIEQCGGLNSEDVTLHMGGPMMGFALHSQAMPVVKGMNCLLLRKQKSEVKPVMACIRCGQCAQACPMSLLPQQLYRYANADEFDKAQAYSLFDCIECGCCEYVCPANLPLVQYYRYAKAGIRVQEQDKRKAAAARERHERRQLRIAAEQQARQQKRRPAPRTASDDLDNREQQQAVSA